MSVINILSPHVADLIAAGEVVERPASVIKELLENSFDAGAKNIICEIRNGGMTYIRVTDDGCGMSPEDAGIAFTRHATSKLADESGLEAISTMGFRGEALAAISSVSRIELITGYALTGEGTRVTLDAGDITDIAPFGCPSGTTMIIKDLFYNTPARQKFLKSDRSEASACLTAALRCALGRPDVSVRFIRDGEDIFFSPGDGRADSCIYSLLGREDASSMLSCISSSDGMNLSGFISSPSNCRGNRSHQFFFVNGRFIKSQLLQTALEQAYRNTLLVGRYPSCVLYLRLPPQNVDVNVHPAKTEVRFGSEKTVFDFIYHAVRFALEEENRLSASHEASPRFDASSSVSSPAEHHADNSDPRIKASPENHIQQKEYLHNESRPEHRQESFLSGSVSYSRAQTSELSFHPTVQNAQVLRKTETLRPSQIDSEKNVENTVQNVETVSTPEYNILGEAFRTYIIVEQNGEILLIDKHAAHERMIFDRLSKNPQEISIQYLLIPETVRLSADDAAVLEKNGELLLSLGFEIEPYGECEYIVRGVPAEMNAGDIAPSIEEICEKIRTGSYSGTSGIRDGILHTVACKAAIKAGWDTSESELRKLVDAVCSGSIKYCPHGRPVSVVISRKELDKLFKRIL